ncbi:UNVERIFIED_CONTAM: hypothetical protein PYX00_011885 [Menopon gallinae]|uniref:protein disulfide-isomerase n=1 Tax=Menopon gallinae TaxID=328185 RepID=A0AAW2H8P8_9NEOP
MTRINSYYILMLTTVTVTLVILLGIVAFSIKSRSVLKKYGEGRNTSPEDAEHQRHAGLSNRNLSCFFNASMQMLFSLEEFRTFAENCNDKGMPTTRIIGNMFRDMRRSEGYVVNIDYYNAILDAFSSAEIAPNEENCASQFLELLIEKVVRENMLAQGVSEQDLLDTSFDNFEALQQRMEMARLFGLLILSTGYQGYTTDYSPTQTSYIHIPLQVEWYIRSSTRENMQRTVDAIVLGDPDVTPTRLVVHNGLVCKYLVLNFGSQGFSLQNIEWEDNEEVQVNGVRFSLVAMNLFRGSVQCPQSKNGGRHYMSCARRGGSLIGETERDRVDMKHFQEKARDVKFFFPNSGSGVGMEHKGRRFSFESKDSNKVLGLLGLFNKFDATYPDMLEIVAGLERLEGESEEDEVRRGARSFAIFFVNEESVEKLRDGSSALKIFLSTDAELARRLGVPFPGIYGYNAGDKISYSLEVREDYLRASDAVAMPLLGLITGENVDTYEAAESPAFYILAKPEIHGSLKSEFREVAKKLRNRAKLCLMAYDRSRTNIRRMGLGEEDLPSILIIKEGMKYREGKITPESVEAFVTGFLDGTLKPFALSGVEPDDNEKNAVKIIVHNGREKWLGDRTRDKLVVFHAPWCKFCKDLKPVILSLGEHVQKHASDKIMVGMFDMTENEMPDLDVNGYPTIYLIKATTNEPVLFEGGDRSMSKLIEFLHLHGNNKVDLSAAISKDGGRDEL